MNRDLETLFEMAVDGLIAIVTFVIIVKFFYILFALIM